MMKKNIKHFQSKLVFFYAVKSLYIAKACYRNVSSSNNYMYMYTFILVGGTCIQSDRAKHTPGLQKKRI